MGIFKPYTNNLSKRSTIEEHPFEKPLVPIVKDVDVKNLLKSVQLKHPYEIGMSYVINEITPGLICIIVIRYVDENRTQYIEGLNNEDPNYIESWQKGLKSVMDYYIYSKSTGLVSILDKLKDLTEKEVLIFLYPQNSDESAICVDLIKNNGEKYYLICINPLNKMSDFIAFLHELGHVIAMEPEPGDYWDLTFGDLKNDSDVIKAEKELGYCFVTTRISGNSRLKIKKAYRKYYSGLGYKKKMDAEMIAEVDAWSCAIWLIGELGIGIFIDTSSDDFINYISYTILTRLRNIENITE